MLTFKDDDFKGAIQDETGLKPVWAPEAFPDVDEDVRQSLARIQASQPVPRAQGCRPGLRLRCHHGSAERGDRELIGCVQTLFRPCTGV